MAKPKTPIVEKKFYVLADYAEEAWKKSEAWKKGDVIILPQEEAEPYIGARILMPFKTAVLTGKYKSTQEQFTPTFEESKPKTKEEPEKKTILKNTLREAVQAKKETSEEKEDDTKESFTQSEPKTSTESKDSKSSAAEDAIKAKIAAAKAKKK